VPDDAEIYDVDVRVCFSHTGPDDMDFLLVGPHGHQVFLMAESGSSDDASDIEQLSGP
jgi:subtilisin-like proprotein convertase family protein